MNSSTALQMEKFKSIDKLLPARGPKIYSSGLGDSEEAFAIYGPKASDQPTLIITEAIYDDDRNMIPSGYYELMLSFDKQTLLLTQSQKIIATIPVFKVEEDKTQEELQPMDSISQWKFDRAQKKKEKKNKKLAAEGKMPTEPGVYNEASIEYDVGGDYYLVKYERGRIRAWGALKLQ